MITFTYCKNIDQHTQNKEENYYHLWSYTSPESFVVTQPITYQQDRYISTYFLDNNGHLYKYTIDKHDTGDSSDMIINKKIINSEDITKVNHICANDDIVLVANTQGSFITLNTDLEILSKYIHKDGVAEIITLTDKGVYFLNFNNEINYLDFKNRTYTIINIEKAGNHKNYAHYKSAVATEDYMFVAKGRMVYILDYDLRMLDAFRCSSACQHIKKYQNNIYCFLQDGSVMCLNNYYNLKNKKFTKYSKTGYKIIDIWKDYYICWDRHNKTLTLFNYTNNSKSIQIQCRSSHYSIHKDSIYCHSNDNTIISYNSITGETKRINYNQNSQNEEYKYLKLYFIDDFDDYVIIQTDKFISMYKIEYEDVETKQN